MTVGYAAFLWDFGIESFARFATLDEAKNHHLAAYNFGMDEDDKETELVWKNPQPGVWFFFQAGDNMPAFIVAGDPAPSSRKELGKIVKRCGFTV